MHEPRALLTYDSFTMTKSKQLRVPKGRDPYYYIGSANSGAPIRGILFYSIYWKLRIVLLSH